MRARMAADEARAWSHSTIAGQLWESGWRLARAIAAAEKIDGDENKCCNISGNAGDSPRRQAGDSAPAGCREPLENTKMTTTRLIDIIKSCPNGIMTYTKGSGSGDPSADNDILWVELESIEEIHPSPEKHAEIAAALSILDPSAEIGEIGDYRVFDVTDYPEINIDQACQQFIVVWP